MSVVSRDIQVLFSVGTLGTLADGRLLERFAAHREEVVFEEIVRRHGPMVWGVCRRILGDHHDAEDAFQASFLVLARRGHCIAHRELVANWLHGVAYQTALKARSTRARRRMREGQVAEIPEPEAASHNHREDLAEWLDRELSGLPEKYRVPIVLCELEGRTHQEAASQLGWPIGTVSGRLSRARAMLARRLTRRGLSLSAGSLAVLLAQESASAAMPAPLIGATARGASLVAAGGAATVGAIPTQVAALVRGVQRAMWLGRIQGAGIALIALVIVSTGLVRVASRGSAVGQEPGGTGPVAGPLDPARTDLERLQGVWTIADLGQVSHQPTEEEKNAFRSGALTVTIRGNRLTYDIDKSFVDFTLDPSRSPRLMTLEVPEGPNRGRHVPAIYRLGGNDDLMICQGRLGDLLPPAGFSIQNRRAGTFPTLWVLKRKPLSESFRATVDEVVKDPGVLVTRIDVESLPGATVEVVADRPGSGGVVSVAPGDPGKPAHTQLTILADQVEWKAGPASVLKFLMSLKSGAGFATTSDTGPMPEGKKLEDVLSLAIKSGEYPYGAATRLATYKDVTYSLVVKRPK